MDDDLITQEPPRFASPCMIAGVLHVSVPWYRPVPSFPRVKEWQDGTGLTSPTEPSELWTNNALIATSSTAREQGPAAPITGMMSCVLTTAGTDSQHPHVEACTVADSDTQVTARITASKGSSADSSNPLSSHRTIAPSFPTSRHARPDILAEIQQFAGRNFGQPQPASEDSCKTTATIHDQTLENEASREVATPQCCKTCARKSPNDDDGYEDVTSCPVTNSKVTRSNLNDLSSTSGLYAAEVRLGLSSQDISNVFTNDVTRSTEEDDASACSVSGNDIREPEKPKSCSGAGDADDATIDCNLSQSSWSTDHDFRANSEITGHEILSLILQSIE